MCVGFDGTWGGGRGKREHLGEPADKSTEFVKKIRTMTNTRINIISLYACCFKYPMEARGIQWLYPKLLCGI